MKKQIDISIVIPCYNEALRLPYTMERLMKWYVTTPFTLEVIFAIEPSNDRTLEVAKQWIENNESLGCVCTLLTNEQRLGKGGNVRNGMLAARGNYIGFMDADGATNLNFFTEAIECFIRQPYLQGVIASRGVEGSQLAMPQPLYRQWLGKLFRYLVQYFTKLPYMDTQCGAKIFRNTVVPVLFTPLEEHGFVFDVEILLRAKQENMLIEEIPCIWTDYEGSTVRPIKDGWDMLKRMMVLAKRFERGEADGTVSVSQYGTK